MTTYLQEPYYFQKQRIDFVHALRITTQAVARWCDWCEIILYMPKKGAEETQKSGMLPENFEERKSFLDSLIQWVINNSASDEAIKFFMDANPIQKNKKFSYHDAGNWNLNISTEEFKELQEIWANNNLPPDLFYPLDKALRLLKPLSLFGRFMTSLGFIWESYEFYSPKMWEEELKKNPEAIKKLSWHIPL